MDGQSVGQTSTTSRCALPLPCCVMPRQAPGCWRLTLQMESLTLDPIDALGVHSKVMHFQVSDWGLVRSGRVWKSERARGRCPPAARCLQSYLIEVLPMPPLAEYRVTCSLSCVHIKSKNVFLASLLHFAFRPGRFLSFVFVIFSRWPEIFCLHPIFINGLNIKIQFADV